MPDRTQLLPLRDTCGDPVVAGPTRHVVRVMGVLVACAKARCDVVRVMKPHSVSITQGTSQLMAGRTLRCVITRQTSLLRRAPGAEVRQPRAASTPNPRRGLAHA